MVGTSGSAQVHARGVGTTSGRCCEVGTVCTSPDAELLGRRAARACPHIPVTMSDKRRLRGRAGAERAGVRRRPYDRANTGAAAKWDCTDDVHTPGGGWSAVAGCGPKVTTWPACLLHCSDRSVQIHVLSERPVDQPPPRRKRRLYRPFGGGPDSSSSDTAWCRQSSRPCAAADFRPAQRANNCGDS